MLTPKEICDEVERVIRAGSNYMTAYQILARLPNEIRHQLLTERGDSGQGSGQRYTAVSVVSQAAIQLCQAEICESDFIDGRDVWFEISGDLKQAGNAACACFRIRRTSDNPESAEE